MANICTSYIAYERVLFCYIALYAKHKPTIFNLLN